MRVLGIGNPDRGDDGAGPEAIHLLKRVLPHGIEARLVSAEPGRLLEEFTGLSACIVLDATAPTGHPGRITRTVWTPNTRISLDPGTSSHGLGLAEGLALAEAIGEIPKTTILWTIEGLSFSRGEPLSGPVAAALPDLVAYVKAEALRLICP